MRAGILLLATIAVASNTPRADVIRNAVLLVGASHTVGYSEHFPCEHGVLARSGHQSSWMREHLAGAVIAGQYRRVAVLGGINDILSDVPLEETKENLRAIVDRSRRLEADVMLLTIPSFKGYENPENPWSDWTPAKQEQVDRLNRWIKETYPKQHIDTARYLSRNGMLRTEYRREILPDGYLHLSKKGYLRMAQYVARQLGCEALPSRR